MKYTLRIEVEITGRQSADAFLHGTMNGLVTQLTNSCHTAISRMDPVIVVLSEVRSEVTREVADDEMATGV